MASLSPANARLNTPPRSPATILIPAGSVFDTRPQPPIAGGMLETPSLGVLQLSAADEAVWTPTVRESERPAEGFVSHTAGMKPLKALGFAFNEAPAVLPGNAWAGWISYDLGAAIEPGVLASPADPAEPLAMFHRVDLAALAARDSIAQPPVSRRAVLRSNQGRAGYTAAVERALEYIRAGDIYQANIAHTFSGRYSGCGEELFARLVRSVRPRHGLGLCFPSGHAAPAADASRATALLSLSPELFLSFDASTGRLTTRPMKGTRPGAADPGELRHAVKDRAELAMIVDLMRNDLGRVCRFGSVRVDEPRAIEHHGVGAGAVLQATATVSGEVRQGVSVPDILAATFPPGSVTGAPKLRAMQIIDELEQAPRGPYCGCFGVFHDSGSFELAVAIRTVVLRGPAAQGTNVFRDAELSYSVGAGIVADSDPEAEWRETIDKARILESVFELRAE